MATLWASCSAILPAPALPYLHTSSGSCRAAVRPCCSLPVSLPQFSAFLRLDGSGTTRRQLAGYLLLSLLAVPAHPPALAADESSDSTGEYSEYAAVDDKYSLRIPANWIQGTGKATGERNVTAFFPVDDSSASVNVLISGVGPDYTSLGSFGTIDSFAETLVNGMDRSWKKPPGQAAKLIGSKSINGMYFIEYTVQQPGERKRHLLSVVGMRFNGWYNRLYTVTGQYWEDDKAKYGPLLEKVVQSFKFA